ncbi:MAG: hypothetical protein ACYSWO_15875 [Planctomycetota bacterium]|jgi:hypothetical protein
MKKGLLAIALFVSVLSLSGCSVLVDDQTAELSDATIAEIDAVGELSFDSEKKQRYERIAAREGLPVLAQVHLVEAVLENLAYDSVKQQVLLTLIANPSFSGTAERAILERIDGLAFESSRQSVLEAISDRKT